MLSHSNLSASLAKPNKSERQRSYIISSINRRIQSLTLTTHSPFSMRLSLLAVVSLIVSAVVASEQEPQQLDVIQSRILHTDEAEAAADTAGPVLQHYGSPSDGCDEDEMSFQISGIPGGVCSRKCTDFLPCPTDVPDGVSATPMCALQDTSTGNQYCILVCRADESEPKLLLRNSLVLRDDQCGDATCRPVPGQNGLGICTYDV